MTQRKSTALGGDMRPKRRSSTAEGAIRASVGEGFAYVKDQASGIGVLACEAGHSLCMVVVKNLENGRAARRVVVEPARGLDARGLALAAGDLLQIMKDEAFEVGGTVTTTDLRAIPLQTLMQQVAHVEASFVRDDDDFPGATYVVRPEAMPALGFHNIRDLNAHIRWASAARIYSEHVKRGDRKPIQRVAEIMSCDPIEARTRVQRARRHGYLSSGTSGKSSGTLTDAGEALLRSIAATTSSERTQ